LNAICLKFSISTLKQHFFNSRRIKEGINIHEAGTALKGFFLNVSKNIKIFGRANDPIMPPRQKHVYFIGTYHL